LKSNRLTRWFKYTLMAAAAVVALILGFAVVALMVLDDDDYRALAVRAVESLTGYRMVVEGPFVVDLSAEPSLTAGGIRIDAVSGGPSPHLTSIGQLQVKIALKPLLFGTLLFKHLRAENVTIEAVSSPEENRAADRSIKILPDFINPVFENVVLADIKIKTVDRDSNRKLQLALNHLIIDDIQDKGPLLVTGDGLLNDTGFKIEGRMKFNTKINGSLTAPRLSDLDLFISDDSATEFSAQGAFADPAGGQGGGIKLAGVCKNKAILEWIFPANWQVVEEFKFNAELRHLRSGYWIEDIDAFVANDRDVTFGARGRLQLGTFKHSVPLKQVDLRLHLASSRTDAIRPLLTDSLPEIGSVDVKGHLIGPLEHLALEDLSIIRGGAGAVRVETHGRIGWIPVTSDQKLSDIDVTVSMRATQSKILSSFYGVPVDEIGTVSLTGRVVGASDRFQLKNLEFRSKDSHGLESKMIGGIDFAEQADGKILGRVNFKLDIKAPNMGAGAPLLGANLVPKFGPVHAEAVVVGNTDLLAFEKISITAGKPGKVLIKWSGRVGKFPLGGDQPISEVQTFGSLEAAGTSDFAAMFGVAVPDVGPVRASWREVDRTGIYGVDDVKFVAGDGRNFRLGATGRVASVIQHKEAFVDGVDLKLSVRASDTHSISKLIGVRFPDLGAVDGRLELSGGNDKISAENLHLTLKSKGGLEIVATGGAGYIGLTKELPVRDIDVRLSARAPDTNAIPGLSHLSLPDLGGFYGSARVGERDGVLEIEAFELRSGPENKPTVQAHGQIYHVGNPEQMKLTADFEVDSQPWLAKISTQSVAGMPQLKGSLILAGAADRVRIDTFQMITDGLGGADMQVEGTLKAAADSPELDIRLTSTVKDPAAWGSIFDLSLPQLSSVTIDGRYAGRSKHHRFEGETRLGNTRLQTDLSRTFDSQIPHTNIMVSSDIVHLKDFGLYPEEIGKKPDTPVTPDQSWSNSFFSDQPLPLDVLNSGSFSLSFRADKVAGQNVFLNRLNFDAELKNKRLRIGPFEIGYQHGHLSGESIFDTSGREPELTIKLTAEDVDIADVRSYLQETPAVEGQLNLVVDMQSRGTSNKAIAANLSGQFGLAIENGRIQRGVEMIAADALDLLFTAPARKSYTDLNCLAGRLEFEKGIGTIQILYLDTPGVRARGAGSVNLDAESIDIVINPEAKRRLFKSSSAIRIQGPLNKPSVNKVPAKEAAILAGQLAVPLIALPGRALGYIFSLMRDDTDEESPCLKGLIKEDR
jgi:hypothetical protein